MQTVKHQAAPRPQRPRRRSRGPLLAGGIVAALFCVLVAVLAGYLFAVRPVQAATGPMVTIVNPAEGGRGRINTLLPIQATANHPSGVRRIELYADGALIAAQDTSGTNPTVFLQPWTPITLGRHLLMARAYPAPGGHVDSPLISVNVVDVYRQTTISSGAGGTTIRELADAVGLPPEDILAANPGLPPDPDAPLPPDTLVDVPIPPPPAPPPAEPPAPMPGAPSPATDLTISADCASAQLAWTDSPDETSYVVYRLDAPLMTAIATLPANTTNYTDTLPGLGAWVYQVAAVKDGLEAMTPQTAVATPGDCPPPLPPAAAIEDLILTMDSLVTDQAWDGTYCYFDFNGTGYQRVPLFDFLYMTPQPDGLTYDLHTELPDGGEFHVTADTTAGITLSGECWGKNGAEVSLLGSFSATHGSDQWDGSVLTQTAELETGGVHASPSLAPAFTLSYRIEESTPDVLIPLPWIDMLLGILQLPAPTNLQMSNSVAGCAEYFGVDYAACVFGGIITGGYPTLSWNWTGNAFHDEPHLTRYLITMKATDSTSGTETTLWARNVFRAGPGQEIRRAQIVPSEGLPCGSQIRLQVQAFEGTTASPVSEIDWQTTPACPQMQVTVTFDTFAVAPPGGAADLTDDNAEPCFFCLTDNRLELTGILGANWHLLGTANTGGVPLAPCPDDAWCIGAGSQNVAALNTYSGGIPGPGHNAVSFLHESDFALTVWFWLSELDTAGTSTTSCTGTLTFPPTNPVDWATVINGAYVVSGELVGSTPTEGTCQAGVTVNGVAAP